MFYVCIAHCMRKSTKCQNVTILVSSFGALYFPQICEFATKEVAWSSNQKYIIMYVLCMELYGRTYIQRTFQV